MARGSILTISKQLDSLHKDFREVASLESGERFCISWQGSVGRYSSPDGYFKKAPELIKKIVIIVRKLFQALSRLLTRQNEGKSLKVVASRITTLETLIAQLERSKDTMPTRSLHDLKETLVKVNEAYGHYKKTIDSATPWLKTPKEKEKAAWKGEVDFQLKKIGELTGRIGDLVDKEKSKTKSAEVRQAQQFVGNPHLRLVSLKKTQSSFNKNALIEGLKSEFGEKAVLRVLEQYKLSGKEFLTPDESYAVLIGCRAYITPEDVEGLSLNEVYEKLIKMRSFEPAATISKQEPYKAALERDLEILKELKNWDHYKDNNETFAKYNLTEFLARHVIYGICSSVSEEAQFPDKILVPGMDEKRKPIVFETKLLSAKSGVMGACFVPFGEENPKVVHVVFRGLNCYDSFYRCFSLKDRQYGNLTDAVGLKSYLEQEPVIFERLKPYLRESIHLNVAGHSLGGVDAQRFFISLATERRCEGQKVSLCTFNAPGVNKEDVDKYTISKNSFKIRHFRVNGDVLQEPGQALVGLNVEEGVKAYVFQHGYSGEETRWSHQIYYDAHCLPITLDRISNSEFTITLDKDLKGSEAWDDLVTGLGRRAGVKPDTNDSSIVFVSDPKIKMLPDSAGDQHEEAV